MDWFIREPYRHQGLSGGQPIIRRTSTDDQLPVPLADLKLDLRIDDDDDGNTLKRMERTAAALMEVRSGKVVMPGTFEALFDGCEAVRVKRAPLRQVTSIAALTDRNAWTELELDDFRVIQTDVDFMISAYPGFVAPTLFTPEKSLRIRFRAGWDTDPASGESDSDSPMSGDELVGPLPDLYRGVLIALTGHFYANRELFEADKLTELESTAGGLLNAIRTFW
jgi:uncharacterized phiE125 gp8 family phage protein